MKKESSVLFTKVEKPSDVAVGDELAWESYADRNSDSNFYLSKVTKVTPKGLTAEVPAFPGRYGGTVTKELTFRMRSLYGTRGGEEFLEPYGSDSTGTLYKMTGPQASDIVQAAVAARKAYADKEKAEKDAQHQERMERIARERAEAMEANPAVEWAQFATHHDDVYYHANVLSARGTVVLAVVAVRRAKNDDWDDEKRAAKPFIYKAAINYDNHDSTYGPNTMGSMSDVKADSLDELFREVIYRLWR